MWYGYQFVFPVLCGNTLSGATNDKKQSKYQSSALLTLYQGISTAKGHLIVMTSLFKGLDNSIRSDNAVPFYLQVIPW